MRKILSSTGLLVVALYLPQEGFAGQSVTAYQSTQNTASSFQEGQAAGGGEVSLDARYDKISQELVRNKELLEIWKDHVRSVTKERDEAFKQIEALKSGVPGVSNEPALSELSELKAENERLKLSIRGLEETRSDKEVILREKELALQKIDELEAQLKAGVSSTTTAAPAAWQEQKIKSMQDAYDELEANFKEQQEKIRRLQLEKLEDKTKAQELKTQISKLQSGSEDRLNAQAVELQEAKAAIQTLRSEKEKTLEQMNSSVRTLEAKNEELRKSFGKLDADYKAQTQSQIDKLMVLSTEKDTLNGQIELLQAKVEVLEADNRQAAELKQQLNTIGAEKEALQKNLSVMIQSLKSDVDQLRTENQKAQALKEELDRTNVQLRNENKMVSQKNQELRADLQANLSDIQKLRSNFGSYLDSLEQSFTEKQKAHTKTTTAQ